MASMSDLANSYAQDGPEAGFALADIRLAKQRAQAEYNTGTERNARNYRQFDLPSLYSGQAAMGAFNSSATNFKRTQLGQAAADTQTDLQYKKDSTLAQLASDAVMAQSGIRIGGSYPV